MGEKEKKEKIRSFSKSRSPQDVIMVQHGGTSGSVIPNLDLIVPYPQRIGLFTQRKFIDRSAVNGIGRIRL